MDKYLKLIKSAIYDFLEFELSEFKLELESIEYYACRFKLNNRTIISRNAKTTPKKAGQFVTFWKRNNSVIIEPLSEKDQLDFHTTTVQTENILGQFVGLLHRLA